MSHSWKYDRAKSAIDKWIEDVRTVSVVDWTRDKSLESIPTNKAYRMDAVHLYVDILNLRDMLDSTGSEGTTCHKRTLRFLNLHYRAVERILSGAEARRVDFHNQRLHAVISKPYGSDSEADRVRKAVAIAQLIRDVLAETGDEDEQIPNADVRIGIDTGLALAVNNGRNGNREPLFLGSPANKAAKLSSSGPTLGIFLTNDARRVISLEEIDDVARTPLTAEEISSCQDAADLAVDKNSIVDAWREDNEKNPIGSFEFSRSIPPLRDLDISSLSPVNSRRMDTVSVYADVDNFTAYVDAHIGDDEQAKDVVRCLHVIRAELDRVLTSDFGGSRIRFIGDCIHGHILEGTAHQTYDEETVSTATLCAGALRSSFDLALERLQANGIDTDKLGLAIGFEFGPTAISRLGMRGDRVRCSVGRAVIGSEDEQKRCKGDQTAIGGAAYKAASDAVRELFGKDKITSDLTYDDALSALSEDGDKTARSTLKEVYAVSSPALVRAAEEPFRPHCKKA